MVVAREYWKPGLLLQQLETKKIGAVYRNWDHGKAKNNSMGAPPSEIRRKDDGNPREKALENDDADDDNPFIIDAKHPSSERLKKWRVSQPDPLT